MGVSGGSKSTGEGLVFYIDPANSRSYSGIGNTIYDLVNTSIGGTFINGALIDPTNNRSIYIDGVNDYVAFPVNTSLNFGTGDFTVNVWLKASSVTLYGTIFALDNTSQGNGILMYTEQTTGTLRTWCRGVTKVGTIRICTNAWTQVTLTRTSGTCRQYVNGVLDETYSSALAITSDHNLRIGYPYIDNYPFFGYFGQVQAYNRALSVSEILNQYNRNIKKYVATENSADDSLVLYFDPANPRSYSGIGITISDLSGIGNTGTLTNGPTFSALNGGSIILDGTNDYINFGDKLDMGTDNYSFTAWFKLNSVTGYQTIFSKSTATNVDNRYALYLNNNKLQTFMQGNQGVNGPDVDITSAVTLVKNKWYFICAVYERANTLKLYVDGYLDSSGTISQWQNVDIQNSTTFKLGAYANPGDSPTNFTNGNIAYFKAHKKALSSTEILQNYNATKNRYIKVLPPISDALVLNLDAGSRASYVGVGTTWYDLSGNNLNGTLVNGPTFAGTGISSSLVFDRTNDHILIADNSLLNTFSAMTLEVIVKYTTTNDQIFAQKVNYSAGGGYTLELFSSGIAAFCYGSGGTSYLNVAVSSYPANNIYHMLFTLSGNTQTLYINGVSVATNSGGSIPSLSGTVMKIGDRTGSYATSSYFGGNVYLTKFYNRALTAAEVLQNFNAYRTRYGI
jgi:hypothetical protein